MGINYYLKGGVKISIYNKWQIESMVK